MNCQAHRLTTKYTTCACFLICVIFTMYVMLYIQSYAQLSENTLPNMLEYPRSKDISEYLVSSSKCRIPKLNPFNKDTERLYKKNSYISCTKQPLLTYIIVNESLATLHINQSSIPFYSKNGVYCCYSSVIRKPDTNNPDKLITISPCKDFQSEVIVSEDVVLVKCKSNVTHKQVYKNAHAIIRIKENIKKKLNTINTQKPLSVLFIGIDSVSRLNFMREMPKTRSFLEENHWLEFRGYNKIGDNTFPNLMAVLSGMNNSVAYEICKPRQVGYLDKCKILWYDYQNLGYVTAFAEDASTLNTFNFNKKGFVKPPTDFYFRPYLLAAEHELKSFKLDRMAYCTGPETSGERILHLAKDFVEKFKQYPYFGFFWMNTFSHSRLNSLSRMDDKVHEFLEDLWNNQILNNTLVLFLSDHGLRFGKIRYTHTGWLEERLPILFMSVPKWFEQTHPEKYNNLVANQNRLTTPYDVHIMLQDLLVISGTNYSIKPSNACPNCRSLFEEMEVNRSCEDGAIEQHWCTCGGYEKISKENSTVKAAAKYTLDKIHEIIRSNRRAFKNCKKYQIKTVMTASISKNHENWYKNDTYLLLVLKTTPNAIFESTVSVELKDEKLDFNLQGSVSRLDYYAPHSNCVHDSNLKKYCYCKR